jgi:hypothetical protein
VLAWSVSAVARRRAAGGARRPFRRLPCSAALRVREPESRAEPQPLPPRCRRSHQKRPPSSASSFLVRRDFLVGASSSGRSASLPPPAPLPGSQAVLLPPRQRVPPLRVRPASCCETSVMPRVRSPLSTARGPRAATGIPGLALRGFKTSVDMTWRQATSRAHRLPFGPRSGSGGTKPRAPRAHRTQAL